VERHPRQIPVDPRPVASKSREAENGRGDDARDDRRGVMERNGRLVRLARQQVERELRDDGEGEQRFEEPQAEEGKKEKQDVDELVEGGDVANDRERIRRRGAEDATWAAADSGVPIAEECAVTEVVRDHNEEVENR